MKLIIFYPDTSIPPLTDQRPFPLLLAGGNTLLGHAITLAGKRVTALVVVVEPKKSEIGEWLAARFPHLPATVISMADLAPYLTGELLLYNGAVVTNYPFNELPSAETSAVLVVDEASGAPGAFWVADAAHLASLNWSDLFTAPADTILSASAVARHEAIFHFPVTDLESLFYVNKRLLGLGYGSEDAVERSYAEDFTVFPPVFLHETAVVAGCVIGPYVTIDAGVTLHNSIVANSIIGAAANVENIILRDSYLGPGSQVTGQVETKIIFENGDS